MHYVRSNYTRNGILICDNHPGSLSSIYVKHCTLRVPFYPRIEGRRPRRNIDREDEILEHIHNNSARSTRSIAREMGLSHTYVHRTLRDEGL